MIPGRTWIKFFFSFMFLIKDSFIHMFYSASTFDFVQYRWSLSEHKESVIICDFYHMWLFNRGSTSCFENYFLLVFSQKRFPHIYSCVIGLSIFDLLFTTSVYKLLAVRWSGCKMSLHLLSNLFCSLSLNQITTLPWQFSPKTTPHLQMTKPQYFVSNMDIYTHISTALYTYRAIIFLLLNSLLYLA